MTYNREEQKLKNAEALANPKFGDYWHEMFCPYFFVVNVNGNDITVLSFLGGPHSHDRKDEPNARIDNKDNTWSVDPSKYMVVNREWIEKTVKYSSIDGFVADVVNSQKTNAIANEWRDWKQKEMRKEIDRLTDEWEHFTGWKILKD